MCQVTYFFYFLRLSFLSKYEYEWLEIPEPLKYTHEDRQEDSE